MTERRVPSAVVLGSVHMDLIATAARLPGRGESVAGGIFSMSPGGKGGNQACQLALSGTRTRMLTRLGDDMFGRQLLAALQAKGVDTSLIVIDDRAPTGASTVLAAEGDYSSIIASGAAANLSTADIDRAGAAIDGADALVLQLELPAAISGYAARIARNKGKCVVLNASPAPESFAALPRDLARSISVLVVNGVEAGRLLGHTLKPGDIPAAAAGLSARLQIETVVVTAGEAGSVAVRRGETARQTAYPAEVADTVGAGDAFLGTFVTGLLEDLPLKEALRRAAAAGALAVSRRGAYDALPARGEIDQFLARVEKT